MTRATITRTGDRWGIGINGSEQGDFALFQHTAEFSEFRRTSRGFVESVFVAGLPADLEETHTADLVSVTHPDAWRADEAPLEPLAEVPEPDADPQS